MMKYRKLIIGGIALALLALKDLLGIELPLAPEALYSGVIAILGAFGIYQARNV